MLQSTRVFNDEVTRQNQMRWLCGYCFSRTSAILTALGSCGHPSPDPRVDALWPSTNDGEARNITVATSVFSGQLEDVLTTVRVNSLLHMCSAFEAALDGMYVVGAMYRPTAVEPSFQGQALPLALSNAAALASLQSLANRAVTDDATRLKGKYSKRVPSLCGKFGLPVPSGLQTLDRYYKDRNVIAHDQSLQSSSEPMLSHTQINRSRLKLSDLIWKKMLSDFRDCISFLDAQMRGSVVSDEGLCIAVFQAARARKRVTIGQLQDDVSREWGLHRTHQQVLAAVQNAGLSVSTEKKVFRRTVKT